MKSIFCLLAFLSVPGNSNHQIKHHFLDLKSRFLKKKIYMALRMLEGGKGGGGGRGEK
jgi:hypothetical protein